MSECRACPACKAVYHVATQPPRAKGICDLCGRRLIQRADDSPESIRVRLHAYEVSTRSVAEYYEGLGKLVRVQASGSPVEILERSLQALKDTDAKIEKILTDAQRKLYKEMKDNPGRANRGGLGGSKGRKEFRLVRITTTRPLGGT
jgi:Adenylate kinase, active site lid